MFTGHIAAASNRADLQFNIELVDPTTNDFVDFTGATITISMAHSSQTTPVLTGTNLDGHVTVTGPGTCTARFTRSEMTQFGPGDLEIGITVLLADGITHQLFAGQIPIVHGVVAA